MSSNTVEFFDRFGDKVVIHPEYIHYRHRSVNSFCVDEIRTKGVKLMLNSYRTNSAPTMCIHMKDKESAEDAHDKLLAMWHSGSAAAAEKKETEKKNEKNICLFDIDSVAAALVISSMIMLINMAIFKV